MVKPSKHVLESSYTFFKTILSSYEGTFSHFACQATQLRQKSRGLCITEALTEVRVPFSSLPLIYTFVGLLFLIAKNFLNLEVAFRKQSNTFYNVANFVIGVIFECHQCCFLQLKERLLYVSVNCKTQETEKRHGIIHLLTYFLNVLEQLAFNGGALHLEAFLWNFTVTKRFHLHLR